MAVHRLYPGVWPYFFEKMGIKNKKRERNMMPDGGIDYIPQGIDLDTLGSGELPPGIEDICQKAIDDFCVRYKVDDLRSASTSVWSSCCQYVGDRIFKRYRLEDSRTTAGRSGDPVIDVKTVNATMYLWIYFCGIYDKPPMIDHFFRWAGVFRFSLDRLEVELNPIKLYTTKILQELQERGLADRLADGRRNALGIIAILNHWHGWSAPPTVQEDRQKALCAIELPKLGDFSKNDLD